VVSAVAGGAADTRTKILAEALDLFAEKGFSASTTRELAERMGFTKAALYYHFRTKDDLLMALLEPITERIAELTAAARRPGDAGRRQLLAGYADLVGTHRRVIRILSQDPTIARNPQVTTLSREAYGMLSEALRVPGPDRTTALTRVRAALGAIHAALLRAAPEDDAALVRAATLAAASAALGLGPGTGDDAGDGDGGR
jgi:AcrR family transcriptional regulator